MSNENKDGILNGLKIDGKIPKTIYIPAICIAIATILGGFFRIAFFANIMFVVAIAAAIVVPLAYFSTIEQFKKKNPLEEDTGPIIKGRTKATIISYGTLIILNFGFGYWVTAIAFAVALGFAMANTVRYTEAYAKQFGNPDKTEEKKDEE